MDFNELKEAYIEFRVHRLRNRLLGIPPDEAESAAIRRVESLLRSSDYWQVLRRWAPNVHPELLARLLLNIKAELNSQRTYSQLCAYCGVGRPRIVGRHSRKAYETVIQFIFAGNAAYNMAVRIQRRRCRQRMIKEGIRDSHSVYLCW